VNRTFHHPSAKRLVIVDDDGIHEHREGCHVASIRWDELESLTRDRARSNLGTRISLYQPIGQRSLFVSRPRNRELGECISQIWKRRHPDLWLRDRERLKRKAHWAAYFGIPLLIIGPSIAGYLLFVFLGWPESLRNEIEKLHRMTLVGVVFVGIFLLWYRYRTRKSA